MRRQRRRTQLSYLMITLGLVFWGLDTSFQSLWIERWALVAFGVSQALLWELPWRRPLYPWALAYFTLAACLAAHSSVFWTGLSSDAADLLSRGAVDMLLYGFCFLCIVGGRYRTYLVLAALAQAACLFYAGLRGHAGLYVAGLSNPSMAATFVVLALGAEVGWSPLIALAALLVTGRSMPLCTFVLMQVAGLPVRFASAAGALVFAIAYGLYRPGLLNGRAELWGYLWEFMKLHSPWHWALGFGANSTTTWLPVLEMQHGVDPSQAPLSFWAHNDWLSIGFEFGALGLVLALACFACLVKDAPDRRVRSVLVGGAVAMVGNFPLHWPATALVIWFAVGEAALVRRR